MRGSKVNNLPEELILEIFYLLPVISLLSIKSVCKLWRSLISDPEFIKTHTYRNQIRSQKKPSLLMLTNRECNGQARFVASPDFSYYLLKPSFNERSFLRVIGSCNGIICLHDYKSFHLWNPATKQGKRLPIFPKIKNGLAPANPTVKLTFGLDAINDDYKILKFVSPTITTNVAPVVQLYSTRTGFWKEIYVHDKSVSEVLSYVNLRLGPVIKGVLYMCRGEVLVSFNLSNEMFSVVPFPCSLLRYSDILDFEGSVAIICKSSGEEESGISLWILNDNCGHEVSWTKRFIVRDDIRWVYSYLGGGLLYGRSRDENRNGILHTNRKNVFNLPIENLYEVLNYTESLVSIEGFEPVPKLVPT